MQPSRPAPFVHDAALRERLGRHLASHTVRPIDDPSAKRAAVAVLVVPSEPGSDDHDPSPDVPTPMTGVPGDTTGFDGTVSGVAGGAALPPKKPAAPPPRLLSPS